MWDNRHLSWSGCVGVISIGSPCINMWTCRGTPGDTGTLLLQHLWNTPQFAGQNEWSAGKLLSWRRRPQGVANRSASQDPTVTTVENGAALLTAIKRKEIKIGKVWRIYLFPAAKAARLIVPGCDDFSGSATRSLKPVQISRVLSCVQLLWVSFGADSPNLPAASAQSGWLHSASQCEAPPSAPRSTEANYFFVTNLRATVEPDTLVRPLPPRRLLSVLAPQWLDELHSGVRTSTNTNLFRAAGWGRKKKRRKRTTPTCPWHSCVRWHLLSWENWGEPWSCCCHSVVHCAANLKCKRDVFQTLLDGKLGWIAFKRKWEIETCELNY